LLWDIATKKTGFLLNRLYRSVPKVDVCICLPNLFHCSLQVPSNVTDTLGAALVGDQTLIPRANSKLVAFLPNLWITYVKDGGIYVMYLSRKAVKEVQRQLFFHPNGKVDLAVHGEELNIHSYSTLPNSVPLTCSTLDKFVDRCVKTVNDVRSFEICSGCSQGNLKK